MTTYSGYSSKVVLTLIVGDRELALSHLGSRMFIVSDECSSIPACDAQLRVQIDEHVDTREVFLPHGISGPRERTTYF